MKMRKLISILLCGLFCIATLFATTACNNQTNNNDETVTVTDMLGEQVTVKKNPKKVACASRTTYDLLIAFWVADSIDGVYYSLLENEWSTVFDSKANERYSLAYQESYEVFAHLDDLEVTYDQCQHVHYDDENNMYYVFWYNKDGNLVGVSEEHIAYLVYDYSENHALIWIGDIFSREGYELLIDRQLGWIDSGNVEVEFLDDQSLRLIYESQDGVSGNEIITWK